MSSEYTPSSGRRSSSSRRGDRRPGRSSRGGSGTRSRQEHAPAKPVKKTLWQKITSIFGGGDKEPAKSTYSSSSASERSSSRQREPRESTGSSSSEERAPRPKRERPEGFRKPELVEVTTSRIYVGNLSFDATESDLFELFAGVGQVQNVEVVANKYTQKSKGFAFIQMQSVEEAKRAVDELHDKEYMGRKLVVSGAKAIDEKRSDRPDRSRQAEQVPADEPQAEEPQAVQHQPEQ